MTGAVVLTVASLALAVVCAVVIRWLARRARRAADPLGPMPFNVIDRRPSAPMLNRPWRAHETTYDRTCLWRLDIEAEAHMRSDAS